MKTVFADTSFYVALLDRRDQYHEQVREFIKRFTARVVTTDWVLTEVGAHLAPAATRAWFGDLIDQLTNDDTVTIEAIHDPLHQEGVALYRKYRDKDWSVTDCISFVVMRRRGLQEALTHDHHFEQAGFTRLL